MTSSSPLSGDLPPTNISDKGQNKDGSLILLSDKSTVQTKNLDNVILSKHQLDEGQNKDGSIILLSDKSTSDNVILSKPQSDEGQNKDGSTNISDEGQNKDGSIILLSDKSTSDNVILSKRQLAQRARREREKLERPPSLPRFFPSLTPSRRQRAQLERAKSKRICVQSSTVSEKIPEVAVTNVLGPSTPTIIQSDPPISCRDNDSSIILSSNKTTGNSVVLSKRQSGQRARRERERLEHSTISPHFLPSLTPSCYQRAQLEQAKSKRARIQPSTASKKIPEVAVTNLTGPSMTIIPDGSIILASNKPSGDNVILSKYQLERARQERERLERSPCLSRFFPLTPSCRQRAQLERVTYKRYLIQSSTVSEKIPEVAMTNVSGPSMATIIQSEPLFNFRNKVGSIILSSGKSTLDNVILSKRQSGQRVRRERERLESKRALIQPSTVSQKIPDVAVTDVSGPSMTIVIQSDPPFSCHNKDGSVILSSDKPTEDNAILSNRQSGQRARRERERLGRSPILPRFFPSLTPSRRQRAQIERAKAKRALNQAATGSLKIPELAETNISGPSMTTIIPSDPLFSSSEKTTTKTFEEENSRCSLEKPGSGVELTMDLPSVCSSSKISMTRTGEEFHDEPSQCSLEKPEVLVETTVQTNVSGSSPEKPEAVEELRDEPSRCSLEKPEVLVETTVQTNVSGSSPEKPEAVEELHDEPSRGSLEKPEVQVEITVPTNVSRSFSEKPEEPPIGLL